MASDDRKIKTKPAPKNDALPKNKSTPDAASSKAEGAEKDVDLSSPHAAPPGLDKHGWGSSNRRSVVRRALRLRQFFADSLIK